MFSRLGRIVLWKYTDDVPVEKLHRSYRIATWIVRICFGAGVVMASSGAEFMLSKDGLRRDITMVVLLVSCVLCILSIVPAILTFAWASEIEKTLDERGFPIPSDKQIGWRTAVYSMKMCFWFIAIIVGVNLFYRR